ncbi:hypothetical protein GCM10012319_58370 [Comamonas sp. KCTC 72670]|nr:hypothetical protein GCM10012319_58370 [Comamonas sp. KCTC 72670]
MTASVESGSVNAAVREMDCSPKRTATARQAAASTKDPANNPTAREARNPPAPACARRDAAASLTARPSPLPPDAAAGRAPPTHGPA